MGNWYTVDTIKKVFIFDITPNIDVNIESISNMKFKNPSIVPSFKKCTGYRAKWNGIIAVTGSYPIYRFNVDTTTLNVNDCVISVLVMDGDN